MGSMKEKPAGVAFATAAGRDRRTGKVEIAPALLAAHLIDGLKAYVAEHNLVGGTKKARDQVRGELQHRAVDLLDISDDAREQLDGLLTIRALIRDNNERAARIGKVNSKEMLEIAGNLKERLERHGCGIAGPDAESDLRMILRELDGEIARIEQVQERIVPIVRIVLTAEENGLRRTIIQTALIINGMLLQQYAGGELTRFNTIVSQVMAQYVNPTFPESARDLLEGV